MTNPIQLLDDSTIDKIAAGEVVVDPASVVKELVENAIDSKASRLVIKVRSGGFQHIEVVDNGVGIDPESLSLALQRHATSKIKQVEDLLTISSMGFRGEALASIAAVSKLTITSAKQTQRHQGKEIKSIGGKVTPEKTITRPCGTTVRVESLFFNIPARKKFQKSPPRALADITKLVMSLCLAHPEIDFEYFSDGKQVVSTSKPNVEDRHELLLKRAKDIFGNETSQGYIFFENVFGEMEVYGLLGKAILSKPTRASQYFFVNGRLVDSPELSFALGDGYGSLIAERRYPSAVIFLNLPSSAIDVNVHPQKKQIKFKETQEIKNLLRHFVGRALDTSAQKSKPMFQNTTFSYKPKELKPIDSAANFGSFYEKTSKAITENILPETIYDIEEKKGTQWKFKSAFFGLFNSLAFFYSKPLEELFGKSEGLVVIHTSRLKKKMFYEKSIKALSNKQSFIATQGLLFPEKLSLDIHLSMIIDTHLEQLKSVGIELEKFGRGVFLIQAIADGYDLQSVKDLICDFDKEGMQLESKLCQKIAMLSCSRKQTLTEEQAISLIEEGLSQGYLFSSYDGKNIMCHREEKDFEKWF